MVEHQHLTSLMISTPLASALQESLALRNSLLEKLVSMRAAQAASSGASVVQAAPAAWCAFLLAVRLLAVRQHALQS
jgi:hypothetical protein